MTMFRKSKKRWKLVFLAGLLSGACSVFDPLKDQSNDEGDFQAVEVANGTSTTVGNQKILELTADYVKKPVDVLIIRENSNYLNRPPFSYKLFDDEPGYIRSFMNLITRFYFSESEFRIGILEPVFNNDQDALTKSGRLITGAEGEANWFSPQTESLIDRFMERISVSPGAELSNGVVRNNAQFNYPLRVLKDFMKQNETEGSSSFQFLRPNARLSILYVGYLDQVKESTDTSEISKLLNEKIGPGNWTVNVLAPPSDGCEYQVDDTRKAHTNSDRYAANSDDPAEIAAYQRKAKMIRLQELSEGAFESICAESYKDFMEEYYNVSTKNAWFSVDPDGFPIPETIRVYIDETPVEGWTYHPLINRIKLPTSIPVGTKFHVVYSLKDTEGQEIYVKDEFLDEIPELKKTEQTPSEIEFYSSIQGILQSNNCIACHGAYRNYEAAWRDKDKILARINLPDSDPLSMPQNSTFDSAENKGSLLNWISMGL